MHTYQVMGESPTHPTCSCGNCSWEGNFTQTRAIDKCVLTPGDAVPAGRCPDCGMLAYPQVHAHHYVDLKDELPPEHIDIIVELESGCKMMGRNIFGRFALYDQVNDRLIDWDEGETPFAGIVRWMLV